MPKIAVVFLFILATIVKPEVGVASEKRCGWFENPTPANAWLFDRDGQWIIAVQGGHQAEGDWPEFAEWVETNGHHGHGCACMDVEVDHKTSYVLKILKAQAKPFSVCREDRLIKEPK